MVEINCFKGYLIFRDGRVYSKKTKKFLNKKIDRYGYVQYHLKIDGKDKYICAHRLVAMAYIDNDNGYKCVNHKDGNKLNNSVENLEWCTYSYNSWHKCNILDKKPVRFGDKKIKSVNIETGEEILFNSESEASRYYNVSQTTISKKAIDGSVSRKNTRLKNIKFLFC